MHQCRNDAKGTCHGPIPPVHRRTPYGLRNCRNLAAADRLRGPPGAAPGGRSGVIPGARPGVIPKEEKRLPDQTEVCPGNGSWV
ncbi:hypothetical protein GCM10010324_23160 [Streptomyces hiroshimensis]|uniref:Uncharacterized protein n=1 Tax=Streptomyces hiroshimensis TaxID=66424 RepID=A0ABQ2YBF7_9ACTN|nr:hypothetical protein GCM10010324_23160 [Streptomyces hiroshimensis]